MNSTLLSAYNFYYLFFLCFSEFPPVPLALDASTLLFAWKFSLHLANLHLKKTRALNKCLCHQHGLKVKSVSWQPGVKMIPKSRANQYWYPSSLAKKKLLLWVLWPQSTLFIFTVYFKKNYYTETKQLYWQKHKFMLPWLLSTWITRVHQITKSKSQTY